MIWFNLDRQTAQGIQSSQKKWRKLRGFRLLAEIIRGVKFRNGEPVDVFKTNSIKISMDGRGRFLDNIALLSFPCGVLELDQYQFCYGEDILRLHRQALDWFLVQQTTTDFWHYILLYRFPTFGGKTVRKPSFIHEDQSRTIPSQVVF